MENNWRPSRLEILAAAEKTVADVIAPGLKVLFCGINPGLYTAAIGHHFGRPGNRFWPALYASGITPELFSPYQEQALLPLGYGITNVVPRATATAKELTQAEFVQGAARLKEKVHQFHPSILAILGVTAYRVAFSTPGAVIGPQGERLADCRLWILPNPSGLNAHYQIDQLAKLFRELKLAADDIRSDVQ